MQRPSEQATILVVDDNITNLKVATEHLKTEGYAILTARTGESGAERARLAQPDLILLDIQLPGSDGFAICRLLKADPQTRAIPVIFMTALGDLEHKLAGFAVGGVDYVSKPFQVEELLARVSTHLSLYRLQRALQAEVSERKQTEAALRKANLELQRLAVLDELTGVANRRRFDQYLAAQCAQPQSPALSLLLCDVDCFKLYNDHYGHQAGDQCLQLVARAISGAVGRAKDLVARYGGEEFAVIMPDTDLAGAQAVAELIRRDVEQMRLAHARSDVIPYVTLSIGVAWVPPGVPPAPDLFTSDADTALYQAKRQGRNRCVSASAAPSTATATDPGQPAAERRRALQSIERGR
jgi:diguanylate cyclase (GGDEF)-like protein